MLPVTSCFHPFTRNPHIWGQIKGATLIWGYGNNEALSHSLLPTMNEVAGISTHTLVLTHFLNASRMITVLYTL